MKCKNELKLNFRTLPKNHRTKYSNELENKMVVNSSRQNVLLFCCFYKLTPFLNDKKYFYDPHCENAPCLQSILLINQQKTEPEVVRRELSPLFAGSGKTASVKRATLKSPGRVHQDTESE